MPRTSRKAVETPYAKIKPVNLSDRPLPEGEERICNGCELPKYGCVHQPLSKKWLCLACHEKAIAQRMIRYVDEERKALGDVLFIDEAELKGLKADGTMTLRLYVQLALKMEGVGSDPSKVNVFKFCKRWSITKEDLLSAVCSLSKRGIMYVNIEEFTAQVFSRTDRLEMLKKQFQDNG